jgi:AcrR family transcriptional regulator
MTQTRERIVHASAELFRRQGYTGTGVKQIVARASAPFGSLYHFFPGGKEQLGAEVIRWSGAQYGRLVDEVFANAPDIVTGVRAAFASAAEVLEETGYTDACPIATVALEVASTNEQLRIATAEVFTSWLDAIARYFVMAGITPERADELAVVLFTALEGAFILCRARRTPGPLLISGAAVADAVASALPASQA